MEQLYSSLRTEVHSFERHVQDCKAAFDLDTLKSVLALLTEGHHGEIESLDTIQHLARAQKSTEQSVVKLTFNDRSADIDGYISWFFSYLGHLGKLKETFDEKLVIPLCENLYVNEEEVALDTSFASSSDSSLSSLQGSLPMSGHKRQRESTMESITEVANELFSIRRKWALLLAPGPIRAENFSPQSVPHGLWGTQCFEKVLRLVPDVFYKSLLACNLATQWLDHHQRKYSDRVPQKLSTHCNFQAGSESFKSLDSERMENIQVTSGLLQTASWESQGERMGEIRAKLRDSRMELMMLAWRDKRSMALEKKIREVSQRIQTFQFMLGEKRNEMDLLLHRAEWEARDVEEEEMLNQKYRETAAQVQNLEKHLKLEEYHQKILKGDWMLELEIRPALIRQIDMIQDRCKEHEEKLKAKEGLEIHPELVQGSNFPSPDTISIISSSSNVFSLK
ncbi:uncharacterized protein LOC131738171 [Acipenser ruthenus]|uniref:uncharacterized protein LOC131738171 n=1 Tax=Acipenser ruthenus TaxID=7906 RepID=UPI0027414BE3|nr:uncharacterized protein LOC131738171 [Acipenser ruthenus]